METIARLENAALAAWPAAEERRYDGWLLRYSNGYTKRANSANPLSDGHLPLSAKIAAVESFYRERRLPPTFRLTPLAPADLDRYLNNHGYAYLDPTLVLARPTGPETFALPDPLSFECYPQNRWLTTFSRFSGASKEDEAQHGQILSRIDSPTCFGVLSVEGHPVACGLAVIYHRLGGLFDLITAPEDRRRGYGTALLQSLMAWGGGQGATQLYLQVTTANQPARSLYNKLGFARQYVYFYRRLEH